MKRARFAGMAAAGLTAALLLSACAGTDDRPVEPQTCPADYIKVGASCLDRKPWSPSTWLEADKFCWRRGDVVATPETLLRAMKENPSLFRPTEKTHWATRNRGVFVVNLADSEIASEAEDGRVNPVSGAKRYQISHAFRCEKGPGRVSGSDNVENCNNCLDDAETCSMIAQIFSCLLLLDR